MNYEPVIGLEVHVQLKTESKIFCGCPAKFGAGPNTQTCPVCLGLPGTLPVLNKKVLEYGVKTALALNCSIQPFIKFDRKNYFYPDLPKNYQISQYDLPLSYKGYIDINTDGSIRRIGITRLHLEEDAGKLLHEGSDAASSYVDFNRTGIPLLEIVSEPDINSPQEAYEYLTSLKAILKYLDISDCDMEKGSLRCDANISIRPKGEKKLGTKTELKNMNSFKAVRSALEFELIRQTKAKENNLKITQETLLWDEKMQKTITMRTKEEAHDYRYFPEPDLVPFVIEEKDILSIKNNLPELPRQKYSRLLASYELSEYEANILTSDKNLAEYFEIGAQIYKNYKNLTNWMLGAFLSELNNRKIAPENSPVAARDLINLLKITDEGKINNLTAKAVLTEMFNSGKSADVIIKDKNLAQISDKGMLSKIIDETIKENPSPVSDYKNGKENALMFIMGQAMKKAKGKANPKIINELLKERMKNA
ncbi:MAG: Asp-tRNA(Asn)/Glu-tRNA(Gln) amidotransferase GatCAB subunit B [Candidatus Omnitrophica bacterium CG11_big_fil_rev_8_21_14_0_20_42_13]|uniref:Aspartyl/glutamyl-tRNA(Asn/Gln) amidotransferase subunit B n=1 Tax=Candidatus Ghiorseimicrobium undicola TaxID=1974746 RepID=A0A2H0M2M1_9BACT|nr:MAG: Asp-tRNA(Asn)/Glu-tRNA(Gln) amidotransferase GatCAB subunit B [Candidatus Omnitrophica bacterium CG11_big_fil_rev_8_21_14_0_20_42_13]